MSNKTRRTKATSKKKKKKSGPAWVTSAVPLGIGTAKIVGVKLRKMNRPLSVSTLARSVAAVAGATTTTRSSVTRYL